MSAYPALRHAEKVAILNGDGPSGSLSADFERHVLDEGDEDLFLTAAMSWSVSHELLRAIHARCPAARNFVEGNPVGPLELMARGPMWLHAESGLFQFASRLGRPELGHRLLPYYPSLLTLRRVWQEVGGGSLSDADLGEIEGGAQPFSSSHR